MASSASCQLCGNTDRHMIHASIRSSFLPHLLVANKYLDRRLYSSKRISDSLMSWQGPSGGVCFTSLTRKVSTSPKNRLYCHRIYILPLIAARISSPRRPNVQHAGFYMTTGPRILQGVGGRQHASNLTDTLQPQLLRCSPPRSLQHR